jgi:uncharacterized protein (TIGR03086 family)
MDVRSTHPGWHDQAMTRTSDRYQRLAADMTATIARVPDEQWGNSSPCPDWTARDIVQHLVDTHAMFMGLVGRTQRPGPSVDDDPAGAWASARDQMQADLDHPKRADAEFEGSFGRTTFATAVDRFICFDLVIHRWDLSRATGQDETIDPSELDRLWQDVESFGDRMRAPGAFGAALEPGSNASPEERLLAHLGRQA